MSRTVRTMLIYLVVITVGVTIINSFVSTATAPGEMTLDALQENVRGGLITSVVIKQQSNVVTGSVIEQPFPRVMKATSQRCCSIVG